MKKGREGEAGRAGEGGVGWREGAGGLGVEAGVPGRVSPFEVAELLYRTERVLRGDPGVKTGELLERIVEELKDDGFEGRVKRVALGLRRELGPLEDVPGKKLVEVLKKVLRTVNGASRHSSLKVPVPQEITERGLLKVKMGGISLKEWDVMKNFLKNKGVDVDEMVREGVVEVMIINVRKWGERVVIAKGWTELYNKVNEKGLTIKEICREVNKEKEAGEPKLAESTVARFFWFVNVKSSKFIFPLKKHIFFLKLQKL